LQNQRFTVGLDGIGGFAGKRGYEVSGILTQNFGTETINRNVGPKGQCRILRILELVYRTAPRCASSAGMCFFQITPCP
jgi:hypothetical protein